MAAMAAVSPCRLVAQPASIQSPGLPRGPALHASTAPHSPGQDPLSCRARAAAADSPNQARPACATSSCGSAAPAALTAGQDLAKTPGSRPAAELR
jgi:hypothetical protein